MGQVVSWVGRPRAVDSKMARRVADREEARQGSPGTELNAVKERVGGVVVVVKVI
jgi:hypothetical protein